METNSWCRPMALLVFVIILSFYWSVHSVHLSTSALRFNHPSIEQVVDARDIGLHRSRVHELIDLKQNHADLNDDPECSSSDHQTRHSPCPSKGKIDLLALQEEAREDEGEEEEESEDEWSRKRHEEDEGSRRRHEEEEEESEEEWSRKRHEEDEGSRRRHEEGAGSHEEFVLGKPIKVIETEAGELRVLPHGGIDSELGRRRIGLGFLHLEPSALLLPHYIDAHWLFLVHKGRGRLSWVDDGDLRDVNLEEGDIYKLESGTVFHIHNVDEGQRLSIFGIFDTSSVFTDGVFHTSFVAGGEKPKTVLSGFDESVLATAFKVSLDEVDDILNSQTSGSIIYFVHRNESRSVSSFQNSVMQILDRYIGLPNIFPGDARDKPYNIFKKNADFSNDYGSTTTVHQGDFKPLRDVDKGVFWVRLKAGALLAPHWNPRATEIGLITKGEGEIQIVFPNGTIAATEQLQEGNVFYVPQNFPMCQIAARSGPFEFVGFSTSSRPNRPQFLAGANSVLKALDIDVLASAFNIPAEHIHEFLDSQADSVILPGEPLTPAPSSMQSGSVSSSRKDQISFKHKKV